LAAVFQRIMGTWNWLDWTLAAVLVVSVVGAILKGFVRELISLAAVLAGLIIAALGYKHVAVWFEDLTRSHEVALGLGFLSLFVAVLVVGLLVSILARKLIKAAGLLWFDRFLGAVFGLVRGVAVDCIILMVMVAFSIKAETVQRSLLAPYVVTGARVIALAMPRELRAHFDAGFGRLREAIIQSDKKAIQN
jgi:membrane protein required for colicin V production